MKILVVVGSLRMGGQEKMAMLLAKYIHDEKFVIDVVTYDDEVHPYEKELVEKGLKVIHLNYRNYHYIDYSKKLKKVNLERGPYDVIHVHGVLNIGVNMFIAKKMGITTRIAHCHSANNGRKYNDLLTIIYEKVMKNMIAKYATVHLACGEEAANYLYKDKVNNKIIIPNGIEVNDYKFNEIQRNKYRKIFGYKSDDIVLGIVARLAVIKNHLLLINVMQELIKINKNFKLLIVGDGEMREQIENKISRESMSEYVQLIGEREDVHNILNCMDYSILVSEYEGMPLSMIEAQANGLTCIASNNIDQHINITGYVEFIDIRKSYKQIAEEISMISRKDRNKSYDILKQSAYNIEYSAELLKNIYMSRRTESD